VTGQHLLAMIDQHSRVVLGQLAVDVTAEGTAEGKAARSTSSAH
jgi:hypothetical protein